MYRQCGGGGSGRRRWWCVIRFAVHNFRDGSEKIVIVDNIDVNDIDVNEGGTVIDGDRGIIRGAMVNWIYPDDSRKWVKVA